MIDRRNYADARAHLAYRAKVFRDAPGTQGNRWSALRLILIWADEALLSTAPSIRPSYPTFLAEQVRDGQPLAQSTVDGMIAVARTFFRWALTAYPGRYRGISPLWLDTLQAPNVPTAAPSRELYTLDDVRAMVTGGDGTLRCLRIQAAVALLFLSGMRAGAFVTLPIKALNLGRREVHQWTSLGVQTKFSKTATTYLLAIPELLEVVRGWDSLVRRELPDDAMWYANLSEHPIEPKRVVAVLRQTRNRTHALRCELRYLCAQIGVRYLSPHHFRHGHVVHAEAFAETMADRKAISENVMHSDLSITDGVYGRLTGGDRRERIGRLGGCDRGSVNQDDVIIQLEALLRQLKAAR